MKLKVVCLTAATFGLLLLHSTATFAMDCPGGWRIMPGYNPSMGGACAAMGLNTRGGTCLPGQPYETLCDDASGGRYKTCQGSQPCYGGGGGYGGRGGGYGGRGGYDDGYYGGGGGYRQPPPPPRGRNLPPCSNWDYSANRPCAPGTVNTDCRGGCDSPR